MTLLIPVSALLLGHSVLGEGLATQHVLGMALIGLGLAAIDGRAVKLVWRGKPIGGCCRTGDGLAYAILQNNPMH